MRALAFAASLLAVPLTAEASPPVRPPATAAARALRPSDRFTADRILDVRALALEAGEGDRLAVLADEGGVITPHVHEKGSWRALPLPVAHCSAVGASALGIHFGRDHRPRVMGHRGEEGARSMVYLRHKDGAWRPEPSEIGALAGERSILFGVLGWADPEVVCKVGGICLLKSRKGWKELKNTLPETAIVRAFGGSGYALTAAGVFVAGDGGFTRVGPPAPWRSAVTGFWVGADGAITVAEPGASALHVLDAPSAGWRSQPSPVAGPRDVVGPAGDRWVGGDGGLVHDGSGGAARVGDPGWRIARVLSTPRGVVAAGSTGVVRVRAIEPPHR